MEVFTVNPVDQVRASVSDAVDQGSRVAFQSMLATAVQTVSRALALERAAEEAALSLGQRRLLGQLREELESTEKVLGQALSEQGRCLIDEPKSGRRRRRLLSRRKGGGEDVASWDGILREALDVLEGGAELLSDLASGQPAEAPVRAVAASVAQLLEQHHDQLQPAVERVRNG